jgi:hypothetical protein
MINMYDLAEGDRVELVDGRRVTIEENMQDGMWVAVREGDASENELTHAQDVLRLVQD